MKFISMKFIFILIGLMLVLKAQTVSPSDGQSRDTSLTNIILHNEVIIPTNPLEFYEQSSEINFVRRTEAVFFISIPFTFLLTNFLYTLFPYGSLGSAYFNGVRTGSSSFGSFLYSYDRLPLYTRVSDPFFVFIWSSTTIWPAVIALNSFIERGIDPNLYQSYKSRIIKNRPHLERVFRSSF